MGLRQRGQGAPAAAPGPFHLAVATAAWPNRRHPAAGCFIQALTRAMAARGTAMTIVAPGPAGPDDAADRGG